jgi:hypothetical protein
VFPVVAIVTGVIVAIDVSTAVASSGCDIPASATSSTAATLGEGLRINSQGHGDSEHSDERDFARHG